MINLKNFRENPSLYKKKYKERFIKNSDQFVDEIIFLDSSDSFTPFRSSYLDSCS